MVAALISVLLAAAPGGFRLDPAEKQLVAYHVHHPFHDVTGTAEKLQGQARRLPDGSIEAEVRVRFADFASGNANRDANARAAVGAEQHPDIVVRALVRPQTPSHYPATEHVAVETQVEVHGITRTERVPVTLAWQAPDRVRATGNFTISLDSFHVARPELLFVPIADRVDVDFDLRWAGEALGRAAPPQKADQPSARPAGSSGLASWPKRRSHGAPSSSCAHGSRA